MVGTEAILLVPCLLSDSLLGKSDPYCIVYTEASYDTRFQRSTIVAHKTIDPEWNGAKFDIELSELDEPLVFEVSHMGSSHFNIACF
jgi:hypothetical protein